MSSVTSSVTTLPSTPLAPETFVPGPHDSAVTFPAGATLPSRDIGAAIDLKPLELSDRATINDTLTRFQPWSSEYSFTNLFAWATAQYRRWGIVDDHLLVSFEPELSLSGRCNRFLMPVGPNPAAVMEKMVREFGTVFMRVDAESAARLPDDIPRQSIEADHDYLYTVEQVLSLKGGQSKKLRQSINRFHAQERQHTTIETLSPENVQDAHSIVDGWLARRIEKAESERDRVGKQEDATGCRRILERLEHFPNLHGIMAYHRGIPRVLCIGELMRHTNAPHGLFVCHFEKSHDAVDGLTIYAAQEHVRSLNPQCILNWEQDTGNPGLRRSKRNWGPVAMGEKMMVGAII